jgi:hypothetical protein
MVTWEALASAPDLLSEVPWPETWQYTGRYPTWWSVTEDQDTVDLVLEDLQDG